MWSDDYGVRLVLLRGLKNGAPRPHPHVKNGLRLDVRLTLHLGQVLGANAFADRNVVAKVLSHVRYGEGLSEVDQEAVGFMKWLNNMHKDDFVARSHYVFLVPTEGVFSCWTAIQRDDNCSSIVAFDGRHLCVWWGDSVNAVFVSCALERADLGPGFIGRNAGCDWANGEPMRNHGMAIDVALASLFKSIAFKNRTKTWCIQFS